MKSAVGPPNGLELREVPQPRPKPTGVLVKVRAAGLNRADLGAARAASHASHGTAGPPLGLEWAGEVGGTGAEGKDIKAGGPGLGGGMGGHGADAGWGWGRPRAVPERT